MKAPWIAAAAIAASAAFSLPAWSDEVPMPPADCPPGARGESDHIGPYCAPTTCQTDSQCKKGELCRERSLCVRTDEHEHHRQPGYKFKRTTITGTCTPAGAACKAPGKCDTAKRCVKRAVATKASSSPPNVKPPAPSKPSSSSRCNVGGPSGAFPRAGWLLLALAAFRLRGRSAGSRKRG